MVRRLWRVAAILTFVIGCTPILLSACVAPTHPPTPPPDPPPANFQTSKLAHLHQAAYNYARYQTLAPDDLLGLKRLTEVCAALEEAGVDDESCREATERVMERQGDQVTRGQGEGEIRNPQSATPNSPAAALREALEAHTDDRRIVAEMLGVPVEDVELGPNLVENGGFEEWVEGRPKWWTWLDMSNRELLNAATFAGGADGLFPFEGQQAAHVNGLWVQRQEDKSLARAGFWHRDEITLETELPYLLSFHYRTTQVPDGNTTVWVSGEPDVFWMDHGLPSTGEVWHHFVAVGWNRSDAEAAIRPLLRSFATGSVAFDNVQVRPVELAEGTEVEPTETHFWIIKSD